MTPNLRSEVILQSTPSVIGNTYNVYTNHYGTQSITVNTDSIWGGDKTMVITNKSLEPLLGKLEELDEEQLESFQQLLKQHYPETFI